MTTEPKVIVRVARRFDAPPERVFDAWLDPVTAGRWLFATPAGQMVRVEIDPRVGGTFSLVERRKGGDIAHNGEYLEIDRPRRLVFSFYVEKDTNENTVVNVGVVPIGLGCELTLSHDMSPGWEHFKDRSEAGWRSLLDGLAAAIGSP